MKNFILIFAVVCNYAYAQAITKQLNNFELHRRNFETSVDSNGKGVSDVFPLKTHYSWNYKFQHTVDCYNNDFTGGSLSDSGIITYTILGSVAQSDSISWNISTNWNRRVHYQTTILSDSGYFNSDTVYNDVDSGKFVLWEKKSGNHQLFVEDPYYYANPIWEFNLSPYDGQLVYRFQSSDSLDEADIKNSDFNFGNPIFYDFTFKSDTGLIVMSATTNGSCGKSIDKTEVTLVNDILTVVPHLGNADQFPLRPLLRQNYPNPFNPSTTIEYTLKKKEYFTIKVYDELGNEIISLVNGEQSEGTHKVVWNGEDQYGRTVATGIYFCQFHTPTFSTVEKLIFVK